MTIRLKDYSGLKKRTEIWQVYRAKLMGRGHLEKMIVNMSLGVREPYRNGALLYVFTTLSVGIWPK